MASIAQFTVNIQSIEHILSRLHGVKPDGKKSGYFAFCPAHPDGTKQRRQSLHVSIENGKILLHCFAGCQTEDIVQALGLSMKDLFLDPSPLPHEGKQIVATYDYKDANGQLLFQVVRYWPKTFRQRRPDPAAKDGWNWSVKGIKQVPYKLPELPAALERDQTVFVVEDEKDADALARLGLLATCNAGGAGKWTQTHFQHFPAKARVVILPDNDDPGRKHAQLVASQLTGRGCRVKVVELPGLPEKCDVSDWLAAGGTKEELLKLVEQTPWGVDVKENIKAFLPHGFTAAELISQDFPEPRWVIPSLLPEGLTILGGKPKIGKSWLALGIAVATAAGERTLGCMQTEPGDVLYLVLEDTPRRLKSRLVSVLQGGKAPCNLYLYTAWSKLDQDALLQLSAWLLQHPATKLIIIDTLQKIRQAQKNNGLYAQDYEALEGLKALADDKRIAILVIHHLKKGSENDLVDLLSGTTGLSGAADAVWILKRERGTADAALYATGRDFEEQELALEFNRETTSWHIWEVLMNTGSHMNESR